LTPLLYDAFPRAIQGRLPWIGFVGLHLLSRLQRFQTTWPLSLTVAFFLGTNLRLDDGLAYRIMVGARRTLLSKTSSYNNSNGYDKNLRQDVESGYGAINNIKPKHKFRDAIKQTMYTNRANEMKKKLIDNVDHEELEMYRKSDESVGEPCISCPM
jgi:hypothetical protein